MRVLGQRVLVELEREKVVGKKSEIITPGGIHLSEGSDAAKIEIGLKVIEVGDEISGIKKGDHILVLPRTGQVMNVEEGKVAFYHINEILCVL